jgi:hypothetical protein
VFNHENTKDENTKKGALDCVALTPLLFFPSVEPKIGSGTRKNKSGVTAPQSKGPFVLGAE